MARAGVCLLMLGCGASLGAHAGLVVTQSRTNEGSKNNSNHSVVRLSVQGEHARSDMLELSQPNPMMGVGSYILMSAGKSEMLIVNPAEKTYMRMDARDLRGFGKMGSQVEQHQQEQGGGAFVTDLKVEKTKDEAGPEMLGMPTRHLVYAISYVQPMGLQNGAVKMHSDVKEMRELWVTHALDSAAAQLGDFRTFSERAGGMGGSLAQLTEVDKQISAEGFALKSVVTIESKMGMEGPPGLALLNPAVLFMKGKGSSSRNVMEVTEVRQGDLPADQFVLPQGYTERELTNPNAGAMPDLNQVPGGHPPQPGSGTSQMPDLNNVPH